MSVLASAPRAEQPALAPPAPIRHGVCRLMLCINQHVYKLRKLPAALRGSVVWKLTKATGDRAGCTYVVARAKGETTCTCPDHSQTGSECKHIRALVATGLLARSTASSPLPSPNQKEDIE